MSENICGEPTNSGEPCHRDAGWGTDRDSGPCTDHTQAYRDPDKLTPEVKSSLIGAAQEGTAKRHCAHISGITDQTLRNWLEWGQEDLENEIQSPCADLFLDFQRARAAGAVRRLKGASDEFVLQASYGYTKTERQEVEMDATHSIDAAEGVTAEFVTYSKDDDGND
ncbi:hypothetical protein [Natrononativus amylolyticus]|uniref:hypothetical protein n=1 Tax=Natrononativus amylolyticus TaxID=2963434 RepID=UPI0020CEF79E|nr:hypothetical protein [Natrononativus amylolyticus]